MKTGKIPVVSAAPEPSEFSRIVSVEAIDRTGLELELEAEAEECAALARRFGLEEVKRLTAIARLTPLPDRELRLVVTFCADVVQLCVITLEPVAVSLSERFEVLCAPPSEGVEEGEVVIDVEADDPPEPLDEDRIDIGEMVAQHLAMAIEPYPRAPGAVMGDVQTGESDSGDGEPPVRPFAVLARLKQGG
jgi:uncharacterized metal-binding protein YceD (DUF177 family)